MTAESNVGARLFLIGKDGVLAGLREITAGVAQLNANIAKGADASKVAAAGYTEQEAALARLGGVMDIYQANLVKTTAATDALAKVGRAAFLGIAAAGAAWTYESIRWAQAYQTQLLQLRTQAGLTVTAMNAIGAAAMKNSAALGISPTAYLQAAYHPASTGFGTAQTISITNYGAKLAAIGNANVEDTVNSLSGVTRSYGYGTGQTGHTAALLNAIVGAGNMHWPDLNSALGSGVANTAKTFGVSLTSLGGALAYLTDRSVPAAQAGTRLRMAISLLGAPSAEAEKFLKIAGLGSTQAQDASSAMAQTLQAAGLSTTQMSSALRNNSGAGGIYNALALLRSHLAGSGMSPEMQAAFISRSFGGGRMGASIEALYNNLPGLAQKSGQISGGATNKKFMEDWISTTKTLQFQLHALGGEVHTLGIEWGDKLMPVVTKGITGLTDTLKWFDHNRGAALALGGAITAILVPAIGVYLYRALLSSGGAIRTVLQGYTQLLGGQSAERASLALTDASLSTTTGATWRLVAADDALRGASGLPVVGGPLARTAPKIAPVLPTLALAAVTADQTRRMLQNKPAWDPLHVTKYLKASTATKDIEAAIGYDPKHGLGQNLFHMGSNIWDGVFGHGGDTQQTTTLPRGAIQNYVTVQIDGKAVAASVIKNVKQQAART